MLKLFLRASIYGILMALAAIILEQLLAIAAEIFFQTEIIHTYYSNLSWFLVLGAIVEEGSKAAALKLGIRDGFATRGKKLIAFGFIIGFFFGITEVFFILFSDRQALNLLINFDRGILFSLSTIIFLQAATTFLAASLLAYREKIGFWFFMRILAFPIAIHVLFNFLVIQKSEFTNFLVSLVLGITFLIGLATLLSKRKLLD